MSIKFNCPRCNVALNVPDKLAGKSGKCPKCEEKTTVPELRLDGEAQSIEVQPYEWHIENNGEICEFLKKDDVIRGILDYTYPITSMARKEGMPGWKPISDIEVFREVVYRITAPPRPLREENSEIRPIGDVLPSKTKEMVTPQDTTETRENYSGSIPCPHCRGVVSVKVDTCPHCSGPIKLSDLKEAIQENIDNAKINKQVNAILVIGVVIIAVSAYFFAQTPMGRVEMGLKPRNKNEIETMGKYIEKKIMKKYNKEFDNMKKLFE